MTIYVPFVTRNVIMSNKGTLCSQNTAILSTYTYMLSSTLKTGYIGYIGYKRQPREDNRQNKRSTHHPPLASRRRRTLGRRCQPGRRRRTLGRRCQPGRRRRTLGRRCQPGRRDASRSTETDARATMPAGRQRRTLGRRDASRGDEMPATGQPGRRADSAEIATHTANIVL